VAPRLLRDSHQATSSRLRQQVDAVTRDDERELGRRAAGDRVTARGVPLLIRGGLGGALLESRPGSDEHLAQLS
jgi:hypothetical protein